MRCARFAPLLLALCASSPVVPAPLRSLWHVSTRTLSSVPSSLSLVGALVRDGSCVVVVTCYAYEWSTCCNRLLRAVRLAGLDGALFLRRYLEEHDRLRTGIEYMETTVHVLACAPVVFNVLRVFFRVFFRGEYSLELADLSGWFDA